MREVCKSLLLRLLRKVKENEWGRDTLEAERERRESERGGDSALEKSQRD